MSSVVEQLEADRRELTDLMRLYSAVVDSSKASTSRPFLELRVRLMAALEAMEILLESVNRLSAIDRTKLATPLREWRRKRSNAVKALRK